jgi:hypothetical protein
MGSDTGDGKGSGTGGGPGFPPISNDDTPQPGNQERPMDEDEELDEALEETFPASDPVAPSRIDKPGT